MTRKSGDRPLDELERRFQALRDQIRGSARGRPARVGDRSPGGLPGHRRAAGGREGSPPAEAPDCPAAADSPAPADTILRHVFSAIPDMLTVIDRDFNIIMTNWHESGMVPAGGPAGPAQVLPGLSSPGPPLQGLPCPKGLRQRSTSEDRKDQSPGRAKPGNSALFPS